MSLRALEGFAHALAALAGAHWPVPDYSTLSRRERRLRVDPHARLIVGSTGLKVFDEGE